VERLKYKKRGEEGVERLKYKKEGKREVTCFIL
jgi:hypothetical protein